MKKILFTILIFWLCTASVENAPSRYNSFKAGEWFQFRVHYGIFNASYATLELNETTLKGKEVYHVVGRGRTTGLARLFFRVDDNYESYFDKEDLKPYKFIRKIDEGGHTKDLEIDFDHANQEAIITNHKHNTTKKLRTREGVKDMLSAFYFLRNTYHSKDLKVGQDVVLDMLFDDDETFKFKLKFLGKEIIKSKFGKVNCLKFRPYVQSGRVFKEEESLTLWVSDDDNKIPISIKADLAVGSLIADLEGFRGLKHQFKVIAD